MHVVEGLFYLLEENQASFYRWCVSILVEGDGVKEDRSCSDAEERDGPNVLGKPKRIICV
jgi:hypothetical protein